MKLLFFLSLVAVLQFAVGYEVPEQIEVLDEAMSGNVDVIFFCDSTNFSYDLLDTDKRSISQMLQDMMEKRQVLTINRGAYDVDVYLAYCKYIARSKSRPTLAIIPINMRSFSPGWDQRPGWQSEQERFFLDFPFLRSFYKPLLVFKVVSENRISTEQYNQINVYCDEELVGKVGDFDFTCTDPNPAEPEPNRGRQKADALTKIPSADKHLLCSHDRNLPPTLFRGREIASSVAQELRGSRRADQICRQIKDDLSPALKQPYMLLIQRLCPQRNP